MWKCKANHVIILFNFNKYSMHKQTSRDGKNMNIKIFFADFFKARNE